MPFEHYCEVCGEWGSFGYGVSLRKGLLGTWYCREHRPVPIEGAAPVPQDPEFNVLPQDDEKVRITIPEVAKALRLNLRRNDAWKIGAEVRNRYEKRYGKLPPKDLRNKTNDGGTHCFALYPRSMKDEIAKIIMSYKAELDRQGALF